MFICTGSTGSLPRSRERSTRYSDRLHDFPVTISRFYKNVYVNSFFPCKASLWNSLPIECFALNYDLNGCKSAINRHLLTAVFSKEISCMARSFCASFSCNSKPYRGSSVLHGVNTNKKKIKSKCQ